MRRKKFKVFDVVNILLMICLVLVTFYPMYHVVVASFSNPILLKSHTGPLLTILGKPTLEGYKKTLSNVSLLTGFKNTLFYVIVGTTIQVLMTSLGAFVLTRKNFMPRKIVMKLIVFTMFFQGGMIPTYMLIKDVGLLNSPLVMIIYGAVNVYNLIITRTFFETSIPDELYEAATLDGCSHFRYFGTIVLPLSKAVIAVIMLYYLVGHWNDFFNALLYINSDAYQPLQIVLRNILLLNQAMAGTTGSTAGAGAYAQQYADQIKFGVIIVSTLPVLCVYPFIQKYFEKGVMIGAVKG